MYVKRKAVCRSGVRSFEWLALQSTAKPIGIPEMFHFFVLNQPITTNRSKTKSRHQSDGFLMEVYFRNVILFLCVQFHDCHHGTLCVVH